MAQWFRHANSNKHTHNENHLVKQFKSETEFLNAKLFSGKSVLERLGEFMSYEP